MCVYVYAIYYSAFRIKCLMETKEHLLNQTREQGKANRQKARDKKAQLFLDIGNQVAEKGHSWEACPRGLQCKSCKKRITKHCKYEELIRIKAEECEVASEMPIKGGNDAVQLTKAGLLQSLLNKELPGMAPHNFVLQTNYLVCHSCNARSLRHASRDKLISLAQAPCWDQVWTPGPQWEGHASHMMWRKGGKLYCNVCKAHGMPDGNGFRASRSLKKPCGQPMQQTTLPTCFRAKTANG